MLFIESAASLTTNMNGFYSAVFDTSNLKNGLYTVLTTNLYFYSLFKPSFNNLRKPSLQDKSWTHAFLAKVVLLYSTFKYEATARRV